MLQPQKSIKLGLKLAKVLRRPALNSERQLATGTQELERDLDNQIGDIINKQQLIHIPAKVLQQPLSKEERKEEVMVKVRNKMLEYQ